MEDTKPFLKSRIIWKDDDMFELKIIASNGAYTGSTRVYDTSESLSRFAKSLEGFPKDDKPIIHEAGKKGGYAYCSMKFYYINSGPHVAVQVTLEKNVATDYRPEEKDKINLEIFVEPNAIDDFIKQLFAQARKQEGEAILIGYSR